MAILVWRKKNLSRTKIVIKKKKKKHKDRMTNLAWKKKNFLHHWPHGKLWKTEKTLEIKWQIRYGEKVNVDTEMVIRSLWFKKKKKPIMLVC